MLSIFKDHIVVVVQWLSRVQLFATPRTAAHQASLSITISQSLVKLMSIESVMPSNHLILCHPLLFTSALILCISWKKLQSLEVLICNLLIHFPKMLYLIFSLIQILLRKKMSSAVYGGWTASYTLPPPSFCLKLYCQRMKPPIFINTIVPNF